MYIILKFRCDYHVLEDSIYNVIQVKYSIESERIFFFSVTYSIPIHDPRSSYMRLLMKRSPPTKSSSLCVFRVYWFRLLFFTNVTNVTSYFLLSKLNCQTSNLVTSQFFSRQESFKCDNPLNRHSRSDRWQWRTDNSKSVNHSSVSFPCSLYRLIQ